MYYIYKYAASSLQDTGLPGGIQILEAANVCPTYDDTIHRYGGSTSPQMPWPEDEEAPTNSLEDRLDSITKIFKKAVKRMNMNEKTLATEGLCPLFG